MRFSVGRHEKLLQQSLLLAGAQRSSRPSPARRSLVDLATEIAVRKRSPLQLPSALGHVSFTLVAQLVGVSARFLQVGAALMMGLLVWGAVFHPRDEDGVGPGQARRHKWWGVSLTGSRTCAHTHPQT